MLTILEVLINVVVVLLIPLTVYVMARGVPPPEGRLSKYYRAERYLFPVSNLFVIAIGLIALMRLCVHFGLIGAAANEQISPILHVPFFALLVAVLLLWISAYRKVRRQGTNV
jgi:hypothetical protein